MDVLFFPITRFWPPSLLSGFPYRPHDWTWQVESSTAVKGADNVDIGCGNAFGGEEEVVDDSVEKVAFIEYHVVICCSFGDRVQQRMLGIVQPSVRYTAVALWR